MGRRTRWATDVALTWVVAFVAALSAGRIVHWLQRVRDRPAGASMWWAALPAAGAVVAIVIVAVARATPSATEVHAEAMNDGSLDLRGAPARLFALLASVGTGGPLGADTPLMSVGGALGGVVARRTRRPERWLVVATSAAVLAMVIGAPLAAALATSEIAWRRRPPRRDVVPLALGGVAAWVALRLTGERGGIVGVDLGLDVDDMVVGVITIAGVAGLVGRLFATAVRRMEVVRPLHGGALRRRLVAAALSLGAAVPLAWWLTGAPILLGSGEQLRTWSAQQGQLPVLAATVVFVALVRVQIGCGVVGGAVVPLLAIGALLGTLVGRAWLPDVPFVACVGIGACCVLAAGHGAPRTAIAIALSSFGATPAAAVAAVGVVIATLVAGPVSVVARQLPASGRRSGPHVRS